ncbi:hypothetical protein [Pseudolysinimonas sp.]|uniref:PH-like domain-containing protein n=1 Tax=Pseudolysinimonas sp. TaxID=2680009 RepID=UPI00286A7C0C|nr:hypothetical protein [Pseudolysinimonas sp.]
MDRVTPTVVILGIVLLVFVGLALGWRARRSRQAALPALEVPPATLGAPLAVDDGFYVATTHAEAPTDRIAVRGLGFRARAGVAVHPEGVVLSIAGRPDVFIPTSAIVGVGRATWTIDRVVGKDGLVFVRWTYGGTDVDTNLRVAEPASLVAALQTIAPAVKESA